ncbi:MAG TPA: histidine kinase [Bacteroidia bacterium]|jgi:ligand-binding sensor domain-containing protein|nr:histidine kinase [Bacteroidia bacterium]
MKLVTLLKYYCKNPYYILVFSLLLSFHVNAQKLILKNYKVKNGLPSNEVYCVFQDSKGFIWFGTDDGVSRFDGYIFKNYTTEDGLADNVVFGIIEDKHGRIWFRSLSGKLCYIKNDAIYKIGANELISRNTKNAIMSTLYIDKGDTLWCGLKLGDGYFKISPPYTKNNFRKLQTKDGIYIMEIDSENFISGSQFSKKRQIWNTISFYKKHNFQKQIIVPNLNATDIFYHYIPNNNFLIADMEKVFSLRNDTVHPLLSKERVFNRRPILLKETKKYTWLGLLNKGILRCDEKNKLLWNKPEQILDGYSVTDVMIDKEGGTWFSTLENGVYYSSPAHFVSYQDYAEPSTYMSYTIKKIDENHVLMSNKLNEVDIISSDSIIRNVSVTSNKFTQLLKDPGVSSVFINTGNILKSENFAGYLWMKEERQLKKIVDSLNKYSLVFFHANDSITKRNYLFTRHWVCTIDKSAKHTKLFMWLPSRVLSLYQDKKGVIWLGCLDGLWSFEKNKFIYHGNENDLLTNTIEDIKQGADGTSYYATRGNGIIISKDGRYSKITTADGLNSNNCKCLYIDEANTIWVGYKNGICKIRKGTNDWQVFNFNLNENEFDYEVFHIEKIKNKLLLFTNKGLLSYEFDGAETEFPPIVYITKFSINEISHLKDSARVFNYDENFVGLAYIGLSYQSMGKLTYTYNLEGLDTAWHSTQSTSIQYPFLPPGDYTFHIKAISSNGVDSDCEASMNFIIKKPFWQTLWFITTSLMTLIGIIYLLFYYRLKEIKRKEVEKTLFNKQLADLEMKALRSQMNPHFIFNAINSIQNYIVKKDSRSAQDYLAKFARLIRNVLENSKQETISLNNEIETLKLYIELEQLRAPGKFTFHIVVQPGLQLDELAIPPLILQPYVENAILHGLMPLATNNGQLTISIEKKENRLVCIIDDNGLGRKKAGELNQKKQLLHRSIGLSVTEERIKVINKLHNTESGITIEDKINSKGEALGTKVVILINLDK